MGSYNEGKVDVLNWILEHLPEDGTILDVGACDGKWAKMIHALDKDIVVDGIEVFAPNVILNRLDKEYRLITIGNVSDLQYEYYDLVIFGDVLEHMTVEQAQNVLQYARAHSADYIIGVPFEYEQDAIYGNKWEKHVQPDLTPEIFEERYPGHELIIRPREDYAYYHRRTK